MDDIEIAWTDYFRYRSQLRGYDLGRVEAIVRYSTERYIDSVTGRTVAVGTHDDRLVMIPYERTGNIITPVTIHATSRRQINVRVKSGRLNYE